MTGPSPLLPALRSLEPLGLSPAACQGWATTLSGPQAERLAVPLERAFRGLDAAGADTEYLRSAAFPAHVTQVLRAIRIMSLLNSPTVTPIAVTQQMPSNV